MPFERRGYLSAELDGWTKRIRVEEAPTLGLVYSVSQLGQRLLYMIEGKPRTNENMLASAFYIRALQSLQAAIILTERGMYVDGRNAIRSTLETTFYIVATLRSPGFSERIRQSHVRELKKIAKAHGELSSRGVGDPDIHARLMEAVALNIEPEIQEKRLPIQEVAKLAEMEDVYKSFYAGLSHDASHPSLMSINGVWELKPGVSWSLMLGPDYYREESLVDNLLLFAFCGMLLIDHFNNLFIDSADIQDTLRLLFEKYEQLGNARA